MFQSEMPQSSLWMHDITSFIKKNVSDKILIHEFQNIVKSFVNIKWNHVNGLNRK